MSERTQPLILTPPPQGMVTLRGDHASPSLQKAVGNLTGAAMPEPRGVIRNGDHEVIWMSPDELLILLPRGDAAGAVAALKEALGGQHHLAVDVSDARAVFTLSGPGWKDIIARLSPTDLRDLSLDQVRRTRVGQVAAAIWSHEGSSATLICFRSVARYMQDLLENAAKAGAL